MDIVILDEDNVEVYMDYITRDVAENIGRPFYRGLVVTEDDTPVAGMIWEVRNMMQEADNESKITWLKIDDEQAGESMFEEYKKSAAEDEVVKSSFVLPAKSTSKEKEVLKNAGFSVLFMEGDLIRTRLSEIAALKYFEKVQPSERIHALNTMTQRGFNAAVRHFISKGKYGLCEDLAYLPRSFFENEISCYSEMDGDANGLFLFHKYPSGALLVVIMAALGNDYGKILPQMIKFSVTSALENYSDDTEVLIDRHNYASLALSEKLFPSGFGMPVYIGSRQEGLEE